MQAGRVASSARRALRKWEVLTPCSSDLCTCMHTQVQNVNRWPQKCRQAGQPPVHARCCGGGMC
eukprot:1140771-Pelagomonas_calceolata.AAC.21